MPKLEKMYAALLEAPTIGDKDLGAFGSLALKATDGVKVRYWLRKTGEEQGNCGGPWAQVIEERVKRGWWTITATAWPCLPAAGATQADERAAAQAFSDAQAELHAWERTTASEQPGERAEKMMHVRRVEWRWRAIQAAMRAKAQSGRPAS